VGAGVGIVIFVVYIAAYVFFAYAWRRSLRNSGIPSIRPHHGSDPHRQHHLVAAVGGQALWWIILPAHPPVNIVILVMVWIGHRREEGQAGLVGRADVGADRQHHRLLHPGLRHRGCGAGGQDGFKRI
jgi:hypothetical protein